MEFIAEGGQCKVYKIDDSWVYREYKNDGRFPVEFSTIKLMKEKGLRLKRIVVPVDFKYDLDKNIIGSISQFINSEDIDLANVKCSELYTWYLELLCDAEKLSQLKIRMIDFSIYNMLLNANGPFLIDVDSFKHQPESSIEEIRKANIEDLNYTFLYGLIWKVGQFVVKESFEDLFLEIKDFNGTLFEYLQYRNPYDYGEYNKDDGGKHI